MRASTTTALLATLTFLGACTAKVEDKGKLPDVDIHGGEAPKVDVQPADVTVKTDTHTVVTPSVQVTPRDTPKKK